MRLMTFQRLAAIVAVDGCALLSGAVPVLPAERKIVIGRVERIWVGDADLVLRAKIDTGARMTSLGVEDIETFKRGDQDWVGFGVRDEAGHRARLEKKVVRLAVLKRKGAPGTETRPVVLLRLCIANIYQPTQVNLVDRSAFEFPVLVGRRFLFGRAVVDVARQYTSEPRCKEMRGG